MNTTITRTLSVLALGCAVACGGTSFSSGVDGSKKISELDDADVAKICAAAKSTSEDFAKDNKEGLCKFSGAIAGAFAGALGGDPTTTCQSAVDECLAAEPTTEASTCEPKQADCTATIEEMETCYNDSLEAFDELLGDIASKDCAALVTDTSASESAAPASCTALQTKCPSLTFGGISVGTSSTT